MIVYEDHTMSLNFVVLSPGFLPGERIICKINTSSNSHHDKISFIPHPIHVESQSKKASLDAELVTIHPITYLFSVKGWKEGESLIFRSISCDEHINTKIKLQPEFHYIAESKGNLADLLKSQFRILTKIA